MEQLFDFESFVDELRDNSKKRKIIEKYEENVESLREVKDVKNTLFYKEYLSQYNLPKDLDFVLKVPEELYSDFDWDLLLRLTLASFSSSYSLSLTEQWKQNPTDKIEIMLEITVDGAKKVTKKLDELWTFQILRLFEIFLEEQMNYATLMMQEEEECESIENERQFYIKKFKEQMKVLVNEAQTDLLLKDFI